MIVKTGRFGQLTVSDDEKIMMPQGILGFPQDHQFCLVDPGDDTLILWLQCLDNPEIAFPLLEPKIFKTDYAVRLSSAELRELRLENVNQSAVYSILTIPENVTEMTANLKAPLVINLKKQIAKQVVLQENEYSIKHLMFKELRSHLMTIQAQKTREPSPEAALEAEALNRRALVAIRDIPPSLSTVRTLSISGSSAESMGELRLR